MAEAVAERRSDLAVLDDLLAADAGYDDDDDARLSLLLYKVLITDGMHAEHHAQYVVLGTDIYLRWAAQWQAWLAAVHADGRCATT